MASKSSMLQTETFAEWCTLYNAIFCEIFGYRMNESVTELQRALKRPTWEQLLENRRSKFHNSVLQSSLLSRHWHTSRKAFKKRKLWDPQKLGYKHYSQEHGKSEYSTILCDFGLEDTMSQRKVPKNAIFDHFHPQNPPFTQRRVLKIGMHRRWGAFCMCIKNYENRPILRYPKMAKTG